MNLDEDLPSLKSVSNVTKRMELLRQKLQFCSVPANFVSQEPRDKSFVTLKRKALLDLVEFLNSGPARSRQEYLTEPVLLELITMVKSNIFVALPPQLDDYDPDEDDPWLDVTWPHKQVVYELLLRLVVSADFPAKIGKKTGLIDQDFCVCLVSLFESDDPRERDYLKTILHRIYGKFMTHRSFIRKQISYVFARFSFENKRQNGIAELLEILGSIINGFALPLKQEHLTFIRCSLIPLHKSPWMAAFTSQLTYCITQYVEKDQTTAQLIVEKLVEYWPWGNSQKQVHFLNELEEVLELLRPEILRLVAKPLFRCVARCLSSEHFQVCERALFLWNNEHIVNLFKLDASDDIEACDIKLVFAALGRNVDAANPHWNAAVQMLSYNVMDIYKDRYNVDPEVFSKQASALRAPLRHAKRQEMWDALAKETSGMEVESKE
ncbi:Serine/threonine-protein phosphatase 2A 56 kDa regulatory subunit delta isoform [Hondaea fermentalgiana]|uniref:Serine/threonine-protein phosphatase 2A 56 kDa regulatory subunit delta isoform n=1 Tax=Hondaea fermentalgiana TaxID=2315210 RepID=A0A2R5GMX9_9STRA|nr:Serine/threonine-protein phosphatase 2A 56 kDa regulatory subunit delta isoform [Hondaea fermentalgiana]|eukprot:GBG32247.1 Serine/threonine-protein phosphatase 2A 56 kDa regulatory subunit delta isoform [Hondaea fermentalgiana]